MTRTSLGCISTDMATKLANPVAEAIRRLGGMHKASMASGIPYPTLCRYQRHGRIRDLEPTRRLAEAAKLPIEAFYAPKGPA